MNTTKKQQKRTFLVIIISLSLLTSMALSASLIQEAASQTTHDVKIAGFAFVPQNLTISAGDTVRWNNTDPVIHTIWFTFTSNGSTYLLSDPIPPNTVWSHTFTIAPELQYYSFDKLWITGFINTPTGVHDVAVTNIYPTKTVICQGFSGNVSVTVENQGDFDEIFNVTAYANATAVIGTTTVLLPAGSEHAPEVLEVVFLWKTTGHSKGNYTLRAEAEVVSGETDTADNSYIDGWVMITMIGDITGPTPPTPGWPDGKCDMRDVGLVARYFGENVPPAPAICDLTGLKPGVPDGKVDMRDIGLVARHFGETDP
jgi:plastocyanin